MHADNAPHLVALCLVPEAFKAGNVLNAYNIALSRDETPFERASGPSIVRDAMYTALYSRLRAESSSMRDADVQEALYQAGRAGFLAVIRQLSPPLAGGQVNNVVDSILIDIRTVIDGTPAVDVWGRLLSYDKFMETVAFSSIPVVGRLVSLVPSSITDTEAKIVWSTNMLLAIIGIALQLYLTCNYLERLFRAKSISFVVQAYSKVVQRYLVANAIDRFLVLFDAGAAERRWLQQTSKRMQESAMSSSSTVDLDGQMNTILQASKSAKDASAQLAALNVQYTQRVERTRVFDVRSRSESRHVRSLRWSYVAWVLAYIAVVIACVVLILYRQDITIFVLAATVLAVALASYVIQKIDLRV